MIYEFFLINSLLNFSARWLQLIAINSLTTFSLKANDVKMWISKNLISTYKLEYLESNLVIYIN